MKIQLNETLELSSRGSSMREIKPIIRMAAVNILTITGFFTEYFIIDMIEDC